MAQTTWVCNKDVRVALRQSDNLRQGAGASPALPFGYYSGYIYRAYLDFADNIGDLNIIDKAVLWLRTSDQYYIAFGSDPDLNVTRIVTSGWGEGSSEGLSTGNATVYDDVSYDPAIIVQKDVTTATNTWVSVDITALIRAAKTAGALHGIMLSSTGTGSSDVGEFWSRDKGTSYRPYIVVDYTNNRAPNAPGLNSPASGAKYATAAVPTFTITGSDPDAGDTQQAYQLQVSTVSNFASTVWDTGWSTSGQSGFGATRAYAGPALTPGTTYYWRARTRDAALLEGAWTGGRPFSINALPVIASADRPYAGANHVAPIHNLADKVTTLTPKPQFTFKVTAPDGEAITGYEVEISGQPVETVTGSWASGTTIVHKSARTLTNLTSYTVRFRARDAFEGYGAWSATTTFAVKYMQAIYQWNIPGASGLAATLGSVVGTASVLHRTAAAINGGTPGSWATSVPSTVPAYLNTMVRLASSGTAPAQPKLTSLKFTYYASSVLPLGWSFNSGNPWAIDESMRKYGTKSLSITSPGTIRTALQQVQNLAPDTQYVASIWMHVEDYTAGGAGFHVLRADGSTIVSHYPNRNTNGWERFVYPFITESESMVQFYLRADAAFAGTIHFDAAMINEGAVAPDWTPALTGPGGVIDAYGVQIDGREGSIFRVFTSAGSTIEMGAASTGILFGEDASLVRDASGRLMFSTPLGATAPRFGLMLDPTHATGSSGFFVWNSGDSVPRASLGKDPSGRAAVLLGPGGSTGQDTGIYRYAAGVNGVLGGGLLFPERSAMGNAPADGVYMWAQDNGAGKTQLVIRYATGSIVVLNTQV